MAALLGLLDLINSDQDQERGIVMIETRNDLGAVVAILTSSPQVTFSTGYVNTSGIVCDDGVMVIKAPPAVVSRLVKECVLVCMTENGLFVPIKR